MPRYSGEEFTLNNGEKIIFLSEKDLLGVIRLQPGEEAELIGESNGVSEAAREV